MSRRWAAILAVLAGVAPQARADTVADFYKGKLIRIVVGFGSGGGYDAYARLLSRYFGQHIPGNPSVVVQNMPGAGGLRAANFVYTAAPKDGTTIGTFSRDLPLLAMMGTNTGAQFDPRKFTWLGSSSSFADDAYMLMVRADAPATSIAEARRPGGPTLVLGGSGEGASGNDVPMILRDTIGLNVKVVGGYPDTAAIFLAMERGEVNGRTVDLSTLRTFRSHWLMPGGGMRVLLQFARTTRHPDFPDVPDGARARADRCRPRAHRADRAALLHGAALHGAAGCAAGPGAGAAGGVSRNPQGSAISGGGGEAQARREPGRRRRHPADHRAHQRHRAGYPRSFEKVARRDQGRRVKTSRGANPVPIRHEPR
jgi:tripartite-type tricarboxylate transporter receptor subunit TctC